MEAPVREGGSIRMVIGTVESNLTSDQTSPFSPINRQQEGQSIENRIYPQALDPMEYLRKIILFKANLASHKDDDINISSLDLSMRLEKLGKSHYDRFRHQDQLGEIDKALACYSYAIYVSHEGHPNIPRRLERLALLYITRFQRAEELRLQDHQKAASYINRAFSAPESQSDPLRRLSITALLFESRFWRIGNPVDGTKAIQCKTEMISMIHESSPELPIRFESLGVLHEAQFQRTGNRPDIDKAIEYLIQAVSFTPNDPRRLESLGISYRTRSLNIASTTLGDIKKSIEYLMLAVEHTPGSHKELPRRLANLGVAWEAMFRRLGDLHANEQAIHFKERAVNSTSVDNTDFPLRLESLGVSYETRFQRLGQLEDIELAIKHLSRAVDLTLQNDLGLPRRLENLGTCHTALFECIQRPEDSKKAIEYLTRAVEYTPTYHPDRPRVLNNLGMAYKSRFEHSQDKDKFEGDIEKAIEYLTLAVDVTISQNEDHPDLPMRLESLGICYRARFDPQVDTELADLRRAIEYGEDAVSRIPENHVGRARQLVNLGISHEMWHKYTKCYLHLSKALDCFRQASVISIAPPRERFRSARHWARLLPSSTLPKSDCLEAYRTAIDLIPRLVLLGTNTRQRYHDLHQVRDLGVEAASMAIRSGKNDIALEWLEQTRCVVWSQTLLLRSEAPLEQLRNMYPDFTSTDRLQEIINQLYHSSLETDSAQSDLRTRSKLEDIPLSLLRRRLVVEYDEIISRVRNLPGFKDFLQPKCASELIRAARQGPIVIITCHDDSCNALIVRPEHNDVTSISLQGYTYKKAQADYLTIKGSLLAQGMRGFGTIRPKSGGFKDVLNSLWENIVKPVLTSLGFMNPSGKLPHVTWCPTGIMAFLPLHAAGDYVRQSQSRVFDYVVSSYTPTLTALLSSHPHAFNHSCGLVAIGQLDAKNDSDLHLASLPGTDTELAYIKRHTQDKMKYTELVGSDATTENVLRAMGQNEWVHLACHARQDANDPAKSGFFLNGGTLDLATIAQQLFKNKGLAFLSACQTATGHDKLPDEAAHLASCMLVVGYPSVIASMWSVVDDDAPFVADSVYSHLMDCQSISDGEVATALHDAVASLREMVGVMEFHRWVQYVHMGL
ncbi:Dystrophin [Sus scrofa] [Rhizoctonia solani]|uniref:Dystrophin [Sus scrofa] n=1 Tax=Rhizoctonia solani TaxID=456999 RepID=A0A0K6G2N5_9AGAM|nr:Dystrophin [Sus scrofa] [Rhizoctonia solani]